MTYREVEVDYLELRHCFQETARLGARNVEERGARGRLGVKCGLVVRFGDEVEFSREVRDAKKGQGMQRFSARSCSCEHAQVSDKTTVW